MVFAVPHVWQQLSPDALQFLLLNNPAFQLGHMAHLLEAARNVTYTPP
jgi:hypothetical protein